MRNELLTGSERGGRRRFDLVIGADGLHSAVRRLTFGEERRFEHPLGYNAATFLAEGYPHRYMARMATSGSNPCHIPIEHDLRRMGK